MSLRTGTCIVLLLAFMTHAFASHAEAAQEARYQKTTGQFSVILAVMPGELILAPSPTPPPGATPYSAPAAKDTHHVMVSIFDLHGRRITGATVEARVAALGFSGTKRTLEPVTALGAPVYAALFPMLGRGPFRIAVDFRLPGNDHARRVSFYFSHPSFAAPKPKPHKKWEP